MPTWQVLFIKEMFQLKGPSGFPCYQFLKKLCICWCAFNLPLWMLREAFLLTVVFQWIGKPSVTWIFWLFIAAFYLRMVKKFSRILSNEANRLPSRLLNHRKRIYNHFENKLLQKMAITNELWEMAASVHKRMEKRKRNETEASSVPLRIFTIVVDYRRALLRSLK